MNPGEYVKLDNLDDTLVSRFLNEHEYVYKYMPLERLLESLQKGRLTFVNPSKWTDPFDNYLFQKDFLDKYPSLLPLLHCMCLTTNPHSEAYWKAYASVKYSVRLKISSKEFLKRLMATKYSVYFGRMSYIRESDFLNSLKSRVGLKSALNKSFPNHTFMSVFLLKRQPYDYEREIRILIKSNKTKEGLLHLTADLNSVIQEIRLDPRMTRSEETAMKSYLKGFMIKTTKSQLFSKKKIVIQ